METFLPITLKDLTKEGKKKNPKRRKRGSQSSGLVILLKGGSK